MRQQHFSPDRLRAAREAAGLSRERVAVEVGRSYDSVVSYEHGKVTPPTPVLVRLAEACNCPVADLFEAALPEVVG